MNNVNRKVLICAPKGRRLKRPTYCRGQTLVEYALILAVISIVCVGVLLNMQTYVTKIYTSINNNLIISAANQH
jgi:Flp pilus assembly pilin Flp